MVLPVLARHGHASRSRSARWAGRATLLAASLVATCWITSCYSSTEIQLAIDTDVSCAVVRERGVSVFVAATPGALHDTGPVATTHECTEGPSGAEIGTLTLVPSGARDERFALEIVTGVDRTTEDCFPDTSGCIVARRAPRYIAHTSVRLPVRLSTRCKNARCAPSETCDDDTGRCVPVEGCGDDGCSEPEGGTADGGSDATEPACPPGFASCDGDPANGCETDLATSASHCGGCGRSCGAETCAGGTCGSMLVIDNIAMPSAIAVAGDDVYVTSEVAAPNGSLFTCKTGGCAMPVPLVGGMSKPNAVAVDGTWIYFSSSDKFLRRCQRPACAAPTTFGNDSFSAIKVQPTALYAVSEFNAYAARILEGDGGVLTLSISNPLAIAVDTSAVFMTVDTGTQGGILTCPLSGCVPLGRGPQIALTTRDLRGIAVDEKDIYWTETDKGRVMKMSKDFLGPQVIVSETARKPIDVALDGAFVYWTEDGTTDDDGVINSAAKAGGAPVVLASGQRRPYRLAIGGGRVYWTNRVPAGSVRATRVR